MAYQYLTSEAVSMGHPDKLCDQISDAILDLYLTRDPDARVAVEAMATGSAIVLAGEVRSAAGITPAEREHAVRAVLREVGYTEEIGYSPEGVKVLDLVTSQSAEIAHAVDSSRGLMAGDQGMMFGYATDETLELMPLPAMLARSIIHYHEQARRTRLRYLYPDAKAQVTVAYTRDGRPAGVEAVVLSVSHSPEVTFELEEAGLRETLAAEIILPALTDYGFARPPRLLINPAGDWSFCGPPADAGLTGRKIIADTYGGAARHGGGAFSGKDPSKVDRSGAYAARQCALHLIRSGYARRAEVQLSYAIGYRDPISVRVDTFGTGRLPDSELANLLSDTFDLTPSGIIERLDLRFPRYLNTARRGHFGFTADPNAPLTRPWEAPQAPARL